MEASASPKPDAEYHQVFGFILNMEDGNYPITVKQRGTIIRYTKLPDFDFDSRAKWNPQSYTLKPRLRRIISLDNDEVKKNRSLRSNIEVSQMRAICSYNNPKRKVVTISGCDANDLHPRFSKDLLSSPAKTSQRTLKPYVKDKSLSNKSASQFSNSSRYGREIKVSARVDTNLHKKDCNTTRSSNKEVKTNLSSHADKNLKSRDLTRKPTDTVPISKIVTSRSVSAANDNTKELNIIKEILLNDIKSNGPHRNPAERLKQKKTPPPQIKTKLTITKDIGNASKPLTIIRVPIDDRKKTHSNMLTQVNSMPVETFFKLDRSSDTDQFIECKSAKVGTEPLPECTSQITETDDIKISQVNMYETSTQTDSVKEIFESLDIPNVTLTMDKSKSKKNCVNFQSSPSLNLAMPLSVSHGDINSSDLRFCQSASYVYSHSTVMYTTRQKINFHVLGNDEIVSSPPSDPLDYPMKVVSVFNDELNKNKNLTLDDTDKKTKATSGEISVNKVDSLNCSYMCNKLIKPSDIISSIRINNGLLDTEYICEQFQRELNFIDSFFESLQYLESCSLSEKCFSETKVENLVNTPVLFDSTFNVKNTEYNNFLTKLENGANIDDMETMASKSLCLLNILIRDEQRRAKNLLFVLKMREDALKDFTKSQILWLEKKKKHENTDVSTLKKKQRGALLKLQHECGEMQRMRKALLTLSEKRKQALMKTKKNIELQLKNNVNVDKIILEKKKLKRVPSIDRNTAPLKCFELSSSGCEESTTSKYNSDATFLTTELPVFAAAVQSAEKYVQTVASNSSVEHVVVPAAKNFVAVDGGYLNILFHNLSLPQIFSSGKQYEVNEEALKNIINSANNHNSLNDTDVFDKLMDQVKNKDSDRSSTPSTARSLVDEFDQYYKGLLEEEDKSSTETLDRVRHEYSEKQLASKEILVQSSDFKVETEEQCIQISSVPCVCELPVEDKEMMVTTTAIPNGPLPVPVGAAASPNGPLLVPVGAAASPVAQIDGPVSEPKLPISSDSEKDTEDNQLLAGSTTSIASLTAPVNIEAEELRRQQLAIEREIKALEQQQSRLLVVREIPDKPPPPYTPPTSDTRVSKPRRMFVPDETLVEKVETYISGHSFINDETSEPFEMFVKDFCMESMERHKQDQSENPWDSCNLLPQKPQVQTQKLVNKTSMELNDVLTGVAPTVVSGVSSRRSDHIDDILFAEWRRCEPEWTALHTDEAIVKNQLFESIFQKLLSETVDEYKKTVQCDVIASEQIVHAKQ